ncbi:MAG: response regulator [Deltaproteobacteria bacterium]|nr:response regulator [Deltaproteobacteria bacterium]
MPTETERTIRNSPHSYQGTRCGGVRRTTLERRTDSLHQAKIVLAEDDEDMRDLLAGALKRAGYAVDEVADGNELLDHLADGLLAEGRVPPDLIVSDIRMPGWTGLDVLAGLREPDWTVPIILITAFGNEETHAEAERLGAAVLLDKPFDVDDLLQAVHKVISEIS